MGLRTAAPKGARRPLGGAAARQGAREPRLARSALPRRPRPPILALPPLPYQSRCHPRPHWSPSAAFQVPAEVAKAAAAPRRAPQRVLAPRRVPTSLASSPPAPPRGAARSRRRYPRQPSTARAPTAPLDAPQPHSSARRRRGEAHPARRAWPSRRGLAARWS